MHATCCLRNERVPVLTAHVFNEYATVIGVGEHDAFDVVSTDIFFFSLNNLRFGSVPCLKFQETSFSLLRV